jgi:hypothetical protein
MTSKSAPVHQPGEPLVLLTGQPASARSLLVAGTLQLANSAALTIGQSMTVTGTLRTFDAVIDGPGTKTFNGLFDVRGETSLTGEAHNSQGKITRITGSLTIKTSLKNEGTIELGVTGQSADRHPFRKSRPRHY